MEPALSLLFVVMCHIVVWNIMMSNIVAHFVFYCYGNKEICWACFFTSVLNIQERHCILSLCNSLQAVSLIFIVQCSYNVRWSF